MRTSDKLDANYCTHFDKDTVCAQENLERVRTFINFAGKCDTKPFAAHRVGCYTNPTSTRHYAYLQSTANSERDQVQLEEELAVRMVLDCTIALSMLAHHGMS